jgi:hypothetical protein
VLGSGGERQRLLCMAEKAGSVGAHARDAATRGLMSRPICLEQRQHGGRTREMNHATAVGGNVLIVTNARAKLGAEFVICSTEPVGGSPLSRELTERSRLLRDPMTTRLATSIAREPEPGQPFSQMQAAYEIRAARCQPPQAARRSGALDNIRIFASSSRATSSAQ